VNVTYNPLFHRHRKCRIISEVVEMIQTNFGKAIKKIREGTGLSQEKFALSISMDRTYYASVEAGKRNISLQNIYKIANGFGISLSELFAEVEEL